MSQGNEDALTKEIFIKPENMFANNDSNANNSNAGSENNSNADSETSNNSNAGSENNSNAGSEASNNSNANSEASNNSNASSIASNNSQETPESSIQISAPQQEENDGLHIGDRISITTKTNIKVRGRIYYLNPEIMMRIMPDGDSGALHDFEFKNGELNLENIQTDSDGDPMISLLQKGPRLGFIELHSFRTGQTLTALSSTGDLIGSYEIIDSNAKDDKLRIENTETKETLDIDFNGQGIPVDLPFAILRVAPRIEQQTEAPPEEQATESVNEEVEEFELPDIILIQTISAEERIYPELVQKSDFLADLLTQIPQASQKNPAIMRKVRTLVELFSSLKNSSIKRATDGSIEGEEKISIDTLNELLLNRTVPIVRPVLETKRIVMTEQPDEEEKETMQVLIRRLEDVIKQSDEFLNLQVAPGEEGVGLPRWNQTLDSYFKKFPLGDQFNGGDFSFFKDGEYFRAFSPGSSKLEGLSKPEEGTEYEGSNPEQFIGQIEQSLRRGHGPTVRALIKGGTETYIQPDQANVNGYVLFPYSTVLSGALGAIRTGSLWDSIIRSRSEVTWMANLLEVLGGISDVKDAQNILYLNSAEAVSISFSSYLQMLLQTIVIKGAGDLTALKADLGIQEMEINLEQNEILQTRINQITASLRTMINQKRKDQTVTPPVINSLIEGYITTISDTIKSHPKLFEISQKIEPNYKGVDLANFATLYTKAQDYFLASLSKNPKTINLELMRYTREELLTVLRNASQKEILEKNRGFPPQPNPCEHTDTLTVIRKIKDSTQRIMALSKFVTKYKAGREENWVQCSVCDQHLVCHHELLQIQQFLHPRESQAIQKEIVLGYAGGTFGRNYICRNCGLPIAEMEFDTSIEYDDEGKPLMGRSELVDQDELDKEGLEDLFGPRLEKQEEISFETNLKTEFYKIASVICNRIGVALDGFAYKQLVDRADATSRQMIIDQPTFKAQGKDIKLYPRYITRSKIGIVAALILLDIQTRTPDYIVRYVLEGCKAGFGGYPLIPDVKPDSEDSTGIQYLVCALVGFFPTFGDSITEKTPKQKDIWLNGFQSIKKESERKQGIQQFIITALNVILERDSRVQEELEKKRKYLTKLYGAGAKGRPGEKIPSGFLPRMEPLAELQTNNAGTPVVEEGTKNKGSSGETHLASAWIENAHRRAKETAVVIKGSPYAETTCCPSLLINPGEFWRATTNPLPRFYSLKSSFARQSIFYNMFTPRPLQLSIGEPSLENAYRVFLEVCWKGPRTGLAHEIGYDGKCDWCDIEIPMEYLYPDIHLEDSTWRAKRVQEEKEKHDLEEQQLQSKIITDFSIRQGVPCTDANGFQAILDAAHTKTQFSVYQSPQPVEPAQLLDIATKLDYAPFDNYQGSVKTAMENMKTLGKEADPVTVANALGPIRNGIEGAQNGFKSILGQRMYTILDSIINNESPEAILEILRSYFIIPLQRINTEYELSSLRLPEQFRKGTTEKLSEDHTIELDTMIKNHTTYINNASIVQESGLGQLKLEYFVEQASSMMKYASELRISRIGFDAKLTEPQLEAFLREILRVTFFGPLWKLLDTSFVPQFESEEEVDLTSESDSVHFKLNEIVKNLIIQYTRERLSYNPTKVREDIAKSREMEKQGFIYRMDVMTDEERQVELVKKRLKIGRWSIGGTKLAYSYDPDQWDKNRMENAANYTLLTGGVEGAAEGTGDEGGYDIGENMEDE